MQGAVASGRSSQAIRGVAIFLIVISLADDHATLTLPPTEFATVLLINNTVDPTWEASIDGNNAPIYRANLNAAALHLPASAAERTIEFTR